VALAKVTEALASIPLPRLTAGSEIGGLVRQDREPAYQKRVANWESFAAGLRRKPELAKVLDWAESVP
jgi:hypothetical protein